MFQSGAHVLVSPIYFLVCLFGCSLSERLSSFFLFIFYVIFFSIEIVSTFSKVVMITGHGAFLFVQGQSFFSLVCFIISFTFCCCVINCRVNCGCTVWTDCINPNGSQMAARSWDLSDFHFVQVTSIMNNYTE